jgi:arylsulfatase A-like enzyme
MEDVLPKVVDRACTFVERAAAARRPFFTYVALNGPHTPWVPSKPFQGRSKRAGLYGDFVEEVDAAVGRIAAALDKTGAAKNTLFIVTSDNGTPWMPEDRDRAGGHEANRPWRGQKADVHEGGHRVPFIVRWPGRAKAGSTAEQLTCLTDIFSSVMEASQAPAAEGGEDSLSFLNALRGGRGPRRSVVHHSSSGMFSIRDGDWKLVLGLGSGGFTRPQRIQPGEGQPDRQLYNLKEDPREAKDLAKEMPERVAELERLLARIQSEGGSSASRDDRR